MINLDFFKAIAVYFILMILVLLGSWVVCNGLKSKGTFSEVKFLRQCPICGHLFFDYSQENICVCPKCKSYVEKEEV